MTAHEITVPDLGDFADVPVIEVHARPGDVVAAEDPLITLESDKATMDVPAPAAGVIADVAVAVGDTVSAGHLIAHLQSAAGGVPAPLAADTTHQRVIGSPTSKRASAKELSRARICHRRRRTHADR